VLENEKKGEVPVPHVPDEPPLAAVRALDVGQRVPEFAVSSLTEEQTAHLKNYHGKPIIVFFYNPATTAVAKEIVGYVKTPERKERR